MGIIEIVGMMLDTYEVTQDEAFRGTMLIPLAAETLRFYDQHWQRGDDGKILYSPSQSLETFFETVNPTPDLASMRYLIPRLLQLPVSDAIRAEWEKQLADQPEIPMSGSGEDARILPAQEFGQATNVENPELYAVFPFRLFTLATASKEDLQTAVNSYHARRNQANQGWQQGSIWAHARPHPGSADGGRPARHGQGGGLSFPRPLRSLLRLDARSGSHLGLPKRSPTHA